MGSAYARVLAAIDVGTNAARLEIVRADPDGSLETLHQQRDPIRPGEGVFVTGRMAPNVEARLVSTLRRYAAVCARHDARIRAVATSAIREAKNGPDVVRRVRAATGIELEVVSGREEARLICSGVLRGRAPHVSGVVLDIGGGSTEVARAAGETPTELWSVPLGAVRLTQIFETDGKVSEDRLAALRAYAAEEFREAITDHPWPVRRALGSSGTIGAVVGFASEDRRTASAREVSRAVDALARMSVEDRRRAFDARRAEIIVAGATVLEAAMRHLGLESVVAVEQGLRDGILAELARNDDQQRDASSAEALVEFGRRFKFDEAHATKVTSLALQLYDRLAPLHRLPAGSRRVLEAAALLHDVGHAVSVNGHHKHSYYLVANADLPGFSDRERELVALVARYHRRSAPSRERADLRELTASELAMIRRLTAMLRVADALDRSHNQPVRALDVSVRRGEVRVAVGARGPTELELWDVERETGLFRRLFGHRLVVARGKARRAPSKRRPRR